MTTSLQVDLGFEVIEHCHCGKADLEDHDYEENGDGMWHEHQYLGPEADTGQAAHPGLVAIQVV